MAARTVVSSFHFPILTSAPRHEVDCAVPAAEYSAERPLGVIRGLMFTMILEIAAGVVGYSGWQLWHWLR